jgi:hypothetical protein
MRKNTMRRLPFFLILFILVACSTATTETNPAVIAPVLTITQVPTKEATKEATPEPSKTPEPSPTPDLRFKDLLPETLEKCMEENVINWETRDADLALLMKKIKENPVFPHKIVGFGSEYTENLPRIEKLNPQVNIAWPDNNGIFISACAGLKMSNGKTLPVFVLPIRRGSSEDADYLAFAVDPEAAKQFAKLRGLDYMGDGTPELYQNFNHEKVTFLSLDITLKRSDFPEPNEIWKDLLTLIPAEPAEAEKYYQNLKDYFDPDHKPFPDEKMNTLRLFINSRIFPSESMLYGVTN